MLFNSFMFPHDVLNRLQTSEKGLPAFFDPVRQWFQSGAGPWLAHTAGTTRCSSTAVWYYDMHDMHDMHNWLNSVDCTFAIS